MKRRSYFLLSLLAIIAGVVFILSYTTISSAVLVMLGGVLFIVAGLLNTAIYVGKRREHGERKPITTFLGYLTGAAAVILGLSMLIFKATFSVAIPYLFGLLMAVMAIAQLIVLLSRRGRLQFSSWFLLAPLVLIGIGIYIATLSAGVCDSTIMLATGIGLAFGGLVWAVEGFIVGRSGTIADEASAETDEKPNESNQTPKPLDESAN